MNFSPSINLTQRASIAAVSSIWNRYDILADIKNLLLGIQNSKPWTNIESNVISSLRGFELPVELKLQLENLVQPMGMQIFKWMSLTQSTFQTYPNLPDRIVFIWTERGTLDCAKMAQLIIESSADKMLCFCLACIFCIDQTIFKLWPDVSHYFSDKIKKDLCAIENNVVIYWIYYLNGELENLMTLTEYCGVKNAYEFAFSLVLESKCICSLSYFLKFIHPERKQKLVLLALQNIFRITRSHDGNVVVFLFSHLTENDLNQIINKNTYSVLTSLLEWPCYEFFMPLANSSWDNLSNLEYLNLFQDIVEFVSRYYVSNIYKNLIKQFWKSTPPPFKEYIKNKCISGTFLSRLFLYQNTDEIIQMVFNDCSAEEKQYMIFYFEGMNICDLLVKKERWDSLKLLIKNCISSQSILEEFMKQYEICKPCYCNQETELRTGILFNKIKEWY